MMAVSKLFLVRAELMSKISNVTMSYLVEDFAGNLSLSLAHYAQSVGTSHKMLLQLNGFVCTNKSII